MSEYKEMGKIECWKRPVLEASRGNNMYPETASGHWPFDQPLEKERHRFPIYKNGAHQD